jgi:3-oxoacyl-[acyl-carrier protein] reductase
MSRLTGKVAVVTGASKGIGAAIAKSLAAEGASVVVNYASSKAGADTVVAAITAAGGKAVAVPGDVSNAAEAQGTIEAAIQNYGRLDMLVNSAGVTAIYPSLELPLEEWKRVLDVNLTGVFLCAQAAAREMIRVKAGVILNIASALRGRGCSKASRVLRDEGGCRHADKGPSNRVGAGRSARKRLCSRLRPNRNGITVG